MAWQGEPDVGAVGEQGSRLVRPPGERQAAREHRPHEAAALGEVERAPVLLQRLGVAAEVGERAARGPVAQELVRVELERPSACSSSAAWSPRNAW